MDHAPGPIIAAEPASVAKTIGTQGSLICVKATQISIMPITVPMIGVQRPMRRNIPAQLAIICGVTDIEKDVPVRSMIPKRISNIAVTMR